MQFDSVEMLNALDAMKIQAQQEGKVLAIEQGDFFTRMTRKIGWKIAPSKDSLNATAVALGPRLKRRMLKTGKRASYAQELQFRKFARGTFARGWFLAKVETLGPVIRIWIVNLVDYAGIVDDKKHVAEQAADIVGRSFERNLKRAAASICDTFNGKPKTSEISGRSGTFTGTQAAPDLGGKNGGS